MRTTDEHVVVNDTGDDLAQRDVVEQGGEAFRQPRRAVRAAVPGQVDHPDPAQHSQHVQFVAESRALFGHGPVDQHGLGGGVVLLVEKRSDRADVDAAGHHGQRSWVAAGGRHGRVDARARGQRRHGQIQRCRGHGVRPPSAQEVQGLSGCLPEQGAVRARGEEAEEHGHGFRLRVIL